MEHASNRLALLLFVTLGGCECGATSLEDAAARVAPIQPSTPVAVDARGCAAGVPELPAKVHRGVCYAHNYQAEGRRGYGSETSRRSLDELQGLGVDWVSITPFGFMSGADATEVRHVGDMRAGESDERVVAELVAARERGLSVLLKPHIWIRGGTYRGQIDPGSDERWAAWFDSYEAWLVGYAELAAEHGVPILTVGVELASTSARFEARWRTLLERVRAVYPGELVYAANWDEAEQVRFWDAVDYIGVQFYPSLADESGSSEQSLRARLDEHLDELDLLATRVGRPVLFTEVGYKSTADTALRPHAWLERMDDAPAVDVQAQARCYRVFLAAISERSWARGVYFWKWFTDPDTDEEGPAGFSPRGKPAEAVLRAAYSTSCRETGGTNG